MIVIYISIDYMLTFQGFEAVDSPGADHCRPSRLSRGNIRMDERPGYANFNLGAIRFQIFSEKKKKKNLFVKKSNQNSPTHLGTRAGFMDPWMQST